MHVAPALDPAAITVLELVIDGRTAQVRARLPVSWWPRSDAHIIAAERAPERQ